MDGNTRRSPTAFVIALGLLSTVLTAALAAPPAAAHDCQELPGWPNDPHDPPGCGDCEEGEHDHEYGAFGVGINRCSSEPVLAARAVGWVGP